MLTRLTIQNYALIDQLEVAFDKGMNTITGETGSGKSIIIDALSMLLGERADTKVLKNKSEKCVIEGEFSIKAYGLKDFFEQQEMEYADISILRREISAQGKSRAFVNDSPVNLSQLKELSELLVDIHSQHETLQIGKAVNQFEMLDSFSGIESKVEIYDTLYKNVKKLEAELFSLEEQEKKSKLDLDYFLFQLNELSDAQLKEGENESLEKELQMLNNAEDIKLALSQSAALTDNEQSGILRQLKEAKNLLSKISSFNSSIEKLVHRMDAVIAEIKDISAELDDLNEKVNYDPKRVGMLNERLDILNRLLFKHRVKSASELIALQNELQEKVNGISSLEDKVTAVRKSLEEEKRKALNSAGEISSLRKKNTEPLQKEVATILSQLAMPYAEIKVVLEETGGLTPHGTDRVSLLFRANKGGELKELSKVASGGEFSRLMLALKSITAAKKTLPTIIFDEIDTGVSGEVAHKMGSIMQQMGKKMQVFCITHLPQVAVKGNSHYKVFKQTTRSNTITGIEKLGEKERVEEIAKMLSGDKLTTAALANAKSLLGSNA